MRSRLTSIGYPGYHNRKNRRALLISEQTVGWQRLVARYNTTSPERQMLNYHVVKYVSISVAVKKLGQPALE